MPQAPTKDGFLAFETFGDPSHEALILIAGNSVQLVGWHGQFCRALADLGLYVIRFDNRDVGLSAKYDYLGKPDLPALFQGKLAKVPYDLSDMAEDVVALMNHLKIPNAHVAGSSMGGMIAQTVAIEHPDRVKSLVSIMSSTGSRTLPPPKPQALNALMMLRANDKADYVASYVNLYRTFTSANATFDAAYFTDRANRSYERSRYFGSTLRHTAAVLASGDRTQKLEQVTHPALIFHGMDDPMVPVKHAIATANALPQSNLCLVRNMGHELSPRIWPSLIQAIKIHLDFQRPIANVA